MSTRRRVGKAVGWSVVGLLGCFALVLSSADWLVYKLSKVTELTGVSFPKDARQVNAHYQDCISRILEAEIALPRRELPTFLGQKLIRRNPAPYGHKAIHGAEHQTTYFFVENGMPTTLAAVEKGEQTATIRIHLDEP